VGGRRQAGGVEVHVVVVRVEAGTDDEEGRGEAEEEGGGGGKREDGGVGRVGGRMREDECKPTKRLSQGFRW